MSFTTHDSGERQAFPGGMVRDVSAGKTRWDLLADGPMLQRWAELLTRGAVKYDARNWMKAAGQAELERFRESAFRHFVQWYLGLEPSEDHAAAVFFNVNGAEYVKASASAAGPALPDEQDRQESNEGQGDLSYAIHP